MIFSPFREDSFMGKIQWKVCSVIGVFGSVSLKSIVQSCRLDTVKNHLRRESLSEGWARSDRSVRTSMWSYLGYFTWHGIICPLWEVPFPKLGVLDWLAVKESWRLAWAALWYFSRSSKSESLRTAAGKMGFFTCLVDSSDPSVGELESPMSIS